MFPSLPSLPSELLVENFSHLSARDIVACQCSCQILNDTVIHSQLLQYLINLGRSGLCDQLLPGYTIAQRIEALKKWEAAWRNLETKRTYHVKDVVTFQFEETFNSTCKIYDDFLIAIDFFGSPGYEYVDLRSFRAEGGGDPWTKITNDSWHDSKVFFAFAVEWDIVVAVLSPARRTASMFIEVQGIRFSEGTPHPDIVGATIPTESPGGHVDAVIVGNRTILNVISGSSQRIFFHSWKDGHFSLLREASKCAWSLGIAMVSRDTIALVGEDNAALELCRIVEEPDGAAPSLQTLVRLGLPPLASNTYISYSFCFRESIPAHWDAPSHVIEGRPPRRFPFRNPPEDGLVVVAIVIGNPGMLRMAPISIVTHLRTLVALASTTTTTTSAEVTFISWEGWGPRVTACFAHNAHPRSDALLGERLATISKGMLSLFDFNSMRIRDTVRRVGNSSRNSVPAPTVEHRSIIPKGTLFEEDVVSELPYIRVIRPAPSGWNRIIKYEEGVAGFSEHRQDGRIHFQVYTTE